MPGVTIRHAKSCDNFKKLFIVIFCIFSITLYIGFKQWQCCSLEDVFLITAIIICAGCSVFVKNLFQNLRRSCSCSKKGSATTIKELLLEAGHQVSTDWTVAEQVGKFI